MSTAVTVLTAVVGVLLGGCTNSSGSDTGIVGGHMDASPSVPGVTQEVFEEPKDRDSAAVLAALRQMDACALIDPGVGPSIGFPPSAQTGDRGPHQCSYVDFKDDDNIVSIAVGAHFDHGSRYAAAPVDLGPSRAYQRTTSLGGLDSCMVDIPVSFELSISVQAEQSTSRKKNIDSCAQARAFAVSAMTKLSDPDKLRVDLAKAPMAQWDACSILKASTGPDPNHDTFTPGAIYSYAGIDSCESTATGTKRRTFQLMLRYTSQPNMETARSITIDGIVMKKVEYTTKSCEMQWSNGPLRGGKDPRFSQFVAIKGPTCADAEALAKSAMKVVAGRPPTGTAQRPLLIPTTEPDDPAPGPCLHFDNQGGYEGCRPAQQRRVPKDSRDLVAAATHDPHVTCSAAAAAVRKHLGEDMRPITFGDHCLFLEHTHTIIVTVTISDTFAPEEYGQQSSLWTNRTRVKVAGHPAISFQNIQDVPQDYDVYISTGDDSTRPGVVNVRLTFNPTRGSLLETKPNIDKAPLLIPLASDIMSSHFN